MPSRQLRGIDQFTRAASAQGSPDNDIDAVGIEMHRAIAIHRVDAAGMAASSLGVRRLFAREVVHHLRTRPTSIPKGRITIGWGVIRIESSVAGLGCRARALSTIASRRV